MEDAFSGSNAAKDMCSGGKFICNLHKIFKKNYKKVIKMLNILFIELYSFSLFASNGQGEGKLYENRNFNALIYKQYELYFCLNKLFIS